MGKEKVYGEVVPGGRAVARRSARHRDDAGRPARVQGGQAGHLDRPAPDAVPLADHEPLLMTVAVPVKPAGRAVAPRGARHREDLGPLAFVQGPQAGHLDRPAPDAVPLADHEPLPMTMAVPVVPAGRAARPPGPNEPAARTSRRRLSSPREHPGQSQANTPGHDLAHAPRQPQPMAAAVSPAPPRAVSIQTDAAGTRLVGPRPCKDDRPRRRGIWPTRACPGTRT